MKHLQKLFVLAALALAGCTPSYKEQYFPVLPDELKDCKIYYVNNGTSYLYITRCPHSDVSTEWTSGKTSTTSVTIDGVEYVRKGGK